MKLMDIRSLLCKYRRLLSITAGVVIFYTLAGFLMLPWFIQRYLTHTLAESVQHPVQVADVRFNPFLLKLQIDGLAILDSDNTPLISFEQFRFDYGFLSIFRLVYDIEEFTIEKPYIKLDADGKGSYTLLHLFAEKQDAKPVAQTGEKPVGESPAVMPAAWLEKLHINGGTIDYRDANRAGGFQQRIDLPNLSIEDFYTQKVGHANHLMLEVRDHDAGVLQLDTIVNLQPLHLTGQLSVQNFNLAPLWQWLMLPVNFHLQVPRIALATQFDMQMKDALDLQLTGGSLSLKNTAFSDKAAPDVQLIKLPLLAVTGVQMNLQQQSVVIDSMQANDGLLDVILDKQGAVNLQALFAPVVQPGAAVPSAVSTSAVMPQTNPQSAPPPAEPTKPWDVLVHQIAVNNYTIRLRDEKPKEAFSITLAPLSVAINEFRPLSNERFAIQLKSGLAGVNSQQSGGVAVDTQLQLTPLVADVHLDLQQFTLPLIQPYVSDAVRANINSGSLNALMDIHFESSEKSKIDVSGAIKVQKLSVTEQGKDRNLVSWDAMDITGLSYQMQSNALKIDKIALEHLNSGVIINADGTINAKTLVVPQPPSKTTSDPVKINIETIALDNADLSFADLSMKPKFKVAMQQMSGSITGLSSNSKSQATVDLKGKVDRYAPVSIKGKVNPLAAKPNLDMHMAFSNLELTTFTPYSGTYAGFNIERGQLSLDIDYKLVDDKIEGKNRIVMDQLQLGSPVESAKAVDLPLRLAIALLKDQNGVIDLGFEVGGDLNDPQFSIGGIIWKVLSNMIMKVVTSPFNALSALAGGSSTEGIDQITFAPGQDQLDEASLKKLQTAADILSKRNTLRLNIQGNTLPEQDRLGIQSQKLIAVLHERDPDIAADIFLSPSAAVEDGGAYKVVSRYYAKQGKEDIGDIKDRIETEMKARGEKPDSKTLQAQAYEQAWQQLQGKFPVTDEDLHQLAMQRAQQIKAVLVEKNGVAAERIFVLEANNDPAKASLTNALILDAN